MNRIPIPKEPVKIALIGTGMRSRTIYKPLFSALTPWVEVVAVCDPVREHADAMADDLHIKAYYDIHQLVKDRPMEAAVVVTPIESHHAISIYLSAHGIHNLIETSWCSLLQQAREMIREARKSNLVLRVAENFFRFPIDRFSKVVKESGYLGSIHRIFSYNDHTGYHNNSRWIAFAGGHPLWAQSMEHSMKTKEFHSTPERFHQDETFRSRFYLFPDNLMVIDQASNIKGFLGRHPRPGYTEWQGEAGTLVHRATDKGWKAQTELRMSSLEDSFCTDSVSPVITEYEDGQWARIYADTPVGTLQYVNSFRQTDIVEHVNREYYGICVMGHLVDFALAVRGLAASEFNEEDALMSMMMEVAAKESVVQDGARVALPLEGELESEHATRNTIRETLSVDPMDVEGMLALSYPKP